MQPTPREAITPTRLGLAVRTLVVAIWAGLVTGLIEALWLWFNQALRDRVIFTSDYILWMTPLLYALLFAVVGILVAVAVALLYPRVRLGAPVFVFVALGVACLFIPVTQIARWAAAVVAVGVGFQAARFAHARPAAVARRAGAGLAALGGIALLCQVVGIVTRDRPRPGEVARDDLPDIVLIVWDTVRSDNLSLHGYEEPTTPGLERLAARSAVFDRAVSPSPWTLPAHGSMFTGRWPHEQSATWLRRLDDEHPTLAEVLAASGYATGGFIANYHYTSYDSGLDRGFAAYRDYRPTWIQFLRSSWLTQTRTMEGLLLARSLADAWRALRSMNFWVGVKRSNDRKHAATVNEEFFEWLDRVEDRPVFAFLNYIDAHQAYWSPPGTQDRFTTADPLVRAYDAAISYLDEQVTALVEGLRERGRLDNAIVVVTSDHGELFGENGLHGHAHNLYYRVLHVPLLVHAPGRIAEGTRVETEVTLRDLPATLLEMAAVDAGGIPGTSLAPHWETADQTGIEDGSGVDGLEPHGGRDTLDSTESVREPLLAEVDEGRNNPPQEPISRGPMKALVSGDLHYILNGDGVEELYDYVRDPREENDLASDPAYADALERFRMALETRKIPTRR